MQPHPFDIARRHGLIPALMSTDIRRLLAGRPHLGRDHAALAAVLRGLGYSSGEVDARLSMASDGVPPALLEAA